MGPRLCKHRATENIDLKRPFEGFNIALYSQLDVPPTGVDNEWDLFSHAIDPWKVIVSLRNNQSSKDVWNMSLGRLVQFLNRNQDDALPFLTFNPGALLVNVDDGALPQEHARLFDFSFDFMFEAIQNVYDGDYTLTVEMKDAIPNGCRINSYLSITPIESDEAMEYELCIDDLSLDKDHLDVNLGNGVTTVTISEDIDVYSQVTSEPLYNKLVKKVERVHYTTENGRHLSMNNHELQSHSRSMLEVRTNSFFIAPCLTVHDKEINTGMNVSVEMIEPSKDVYLIFAKLGYSQNAEISEARAQKRHEEKDEAIISQVR